jgi:hypothetical protein
VGGGRRVCHAHLESVRPSRDIPVAHGWIRPAHSHGSSVERRDLDRVVRMALPGIRPVRHLVVHVVWRAVLRGHVRHHHRELHRGVRAVPDVRRAAQSERAVPRGGGVRQGSAWRLGRQEPAQARLRQHAGRVDRGRRARLDGAARCQGPQDPRHRTGWRAPWKGPTHADHGAEPGGDLSIRGVLHHRPAPIHSGRVPDGRRRARMVCCCSPFPFYYAPPC